MKPLIRVCAQVFEWPIKELTFMEKFIRSKESKFIYATNPQSPRIDRKLFQNAYLREKFL